MEERKHAQEEKERERKPAVEAEAAGHQRATEVMQWRGQHPLAAGSISPRIYKWERLCPQYDESSDIAEYFLTFERLCTLHAIPEDHKMTILVAKLTGRALNIFNKMPIDDALDYGKFKDLVLKQFQVTPETYRVKFRALKREAGLSNVAYVNQMKGLFHKWVKGRDVTSFEGMGDLMIQEQFLTMINDDVKLWLWDKKIDSAESLASYVDQYEQSRTAETYRVKFRALKRGAGLSNVAYVNQMKDLFHKWVKGRDVTSFEGMGDLLIQEQFLTMTNDDVKQCLLDKKMDSANSLASYADQYEQYQTAKEARNIGTKWVEVAERNNPGQGLGGYQKGKPETTPHHQGQPKAPPTPQGKPQTPYCPTTPFSSNPPHPTDPSAWQCFKCNELGHVKANCPKNPSRVQFIAPASHQRSLGPDASQIPSERRETVSVGGKKVTAWRDTGAQVSAIHQSLVDPSLINPEAQVTIQPFKSNSFDLPTAMLPVQYKGWSGKWTFAVYDDYPIPMLLGEDLANHVKLAKRVGMVTRSQAKQAVTPSSVPETSTRTPSVLPETQMEVVEPDTLPTTTTAVVDPVAETQPKPVSEPELAKQPAPEPLPALSPALATPSTVPPPEGTTEPAMAPAADNSIQEAQPEPESPHRAPAESDGAGSRWKPPGGLDGGMKQPTTSQLC
ncbi:uncharacterized protein RBU57_010895 [Macrochelys suwanniensis]